MTGLYPRSVRSLAAASDTPSFTILQFNVLADGLSGLRDDHGGFTLAPPGSLAWAHRRQPLLDEILRFAPDIVCLEEVDHFHDWFEPQLAAHGYTGLFAPKPDSPCLQVSDQRDGCAVFVNARFRVLRHDVLSYACYVPPDRTTLQPQNQVALLVELALYDSPHEVLVACTHLKAAKDAAGEAIRTQEAAMLCRALSAKQGAGHAIVVCGDFNAVPHPTPVMPATTYATMVKDHGYASAYCQEGREPAYTTWKVRPGKEAKHTIDYIFYTSAALAVTAIAEMPASIDACRLPSHRYPSDHMALVATLQWTSEQSHLNAGS